jgi:hypothetical protein
MVAILSLINSIQRSYSLLISIQHQITPPILVQFNCQIESYTALNEEIIIVCLLINLMLMMLNRSVTEINSVGLPTCCDRTAYSSAFNIK